MNNSSNKSIIFLSIGSITIVASLYKFFYYLNNIRESYHHNANINENLKLKLLNMQKKYDKLLTESNELKKFNIDLNLKILELQNLNNEKQLCDKEIQTDTYNSSPIQAIFNLNIEEKISDAKIEKKSPEPDYHIEDMSSLDCDFKIIKNKQNINKKDASFFNITSLFV